MIWTNVRVCHHPLYLDEEGRETIRPTGNLRKSVVNYSALVLLVELNVAGDLKAGSASELMKGGWGLNVPESDTVQFCKQWASEVRGGDDRCRMTYHCLRTGVLLTGMEIEAIA